MKKIAKYLSAIILALSVSSCSKLDQLSLINTFSLLKDSTWTQVRNVNELTKGDRLIFVSGNVAMGHLINDSFSGVEFNPSDATISDAIAQYELGGATGEWTFRNHQGTYLKYANGAMVEKTGSLIWTISIDDTGIATISPKEEPERYIAYSGEGNVFKTSKFLINKTKIYKGQSTVDVYPDSVSISGVDTVAVGGTIQLQANFEPTTTNKKGVSWSVDNDTIASIDSTGLLTGKKVGNVVVTVTSTDIENVSAQFNVEVVASAIKVTSVTLDKSSASLTVGQGTLQLNATVLPNDATDRSLTWISSKESVASVSQSGLVTPISAGTTTIHAKANDGSEMFGKCEITVTSTTPTPDPEPEPDPTPDPEPDPTPVQPSTSKWELVTSSDSLAAGDVITLAANTKKVTASKTITSSTRNGYFSGITSSFSSDYKEISSLNDGSVSFTLGGQKDAWTLKDENGRLLGATSVKKLAWDSGTTTWKITIGGGDATIASTNSSYGKILYNADNNGKRFTNYTSQTSSTMLLPNIYRGSSAEPIYPTSISITGSNELSLNQTAQLSVSFNPTTTNQRNVTWSSSDSSIVSVSSTGLAKGLSEGTAIITATCLGDNGQNISNSLTINVSRIAVTDVSLNINSKEISVGKELSLVATISPSNASNKSVTWTSDNPTVASVSSDGIVTAKKTGKANITVKTADGGFTETCEISVVEQSKAEWTVMIYMCGADLESGTDEYGNIPSARDASGLASSDIDEILNVTGQPDDVNIIIETGGANIWKYNRNYSISNSQLERWHVESKKLVKDSYVTNASMGQSKTFQSFLEWGLTEYPAEKTGVILWNHGGAMRGVCYDELFNDDSLTNSEVKTALSSAFKNTNQTEKLEFIGYDACLMQVQDIAEFNSQYFNYMIGSEESEAGYGWDYDNWVDNLYSGQSTETILKEIVDTFIKDNGGASASSYQGYVADQTLSYLDLSKMEAYKEAWEEMATALSKKLTSSNKSSFNSLVKSVKRFADDEYSSWQYYGTFDAKDFINKLQANSTFKIDSDIANAVLTAMNNLVKYSVAQKGAGNANGLCMFWAVSSNTKKGTYYSSSQTNFANWQSLNSSFGY